MLPNKIKLEISTFLSNKYGEEGVIKGSSSESGGCINNASALSTNVGHFFVKWNNASRFPKMFEKEARGLEVLHKSGHVLVPQPIGLGEASDNAWLILEYIKPGPKSADFFENFATSLAKLHKCSADYFGLDTDNYIGSLPQSNTPTSSWIDFFVSQRLEKQIKMARDKNLIGDSIIKGFSNIYHYLYEFFPIEPPSLLHGDLWGGNIMSGPDGRAYIYDPAVYYGHRFMDIGMSKLFGGFSEDFYKTYDSIFPMGKNWEKSVAIANLYPLMVHVNLFGSSYVGSVKNILKDFT